MEREAIEDLFTPIGPVTLKRMFSGHGVYLRDMIFALHIQGDLFLKTDEETRAAFLKAGSRPFSYARPGRVVETSYHSIPEACFEDEDALRRWTELALQAARRKAARAPAGKKPRAPSRTARAGTKPKKKTGKAG